MRHQGTTDRTMAVRLRILLAALLVSGALPRAAGSQPPVQRPAPSLTAGQPPWPRVSTAAAGSPPAPAPAVQRLPPESIQFVSGGPGNVSAGRETLEQAWAIALTADQQLEARRWEVSSAEQHLQSARTRRWPTLAVEGSYVVRSDEQAFRLGFPGVPLPANAFPFAQDENFAFRTKVDLPLYTSGRIRYGIASAADEVTAAELEVSGSTNNLRLRVAEVYVGVLRAQRDVEVSASNVKTLESHAHDVELLYRHAQVPKNDLLAAQVELSNVRQGAIRAANRLDASRAAYNRQLGRPLTSVVRIAELPLGTVEEDVQRLTVRALRTRAEIARLTAQATALRNQAASLRARNGPQFGLWGQYAFEENRFRTPEGIASVGVGLNYDVFDAGRNRHEAAALLQRAEALTRLRADLESVIALEVRRAWLDIQETHRRLEVTSESIQRAEENLRVARKRYLAGMGISTEVLDAETLRTEAYRNHDNATYDAVLAVLRLQHATGQPAP